MLAIKKEKADRLIELVEEILSLGTFLTAREIRGIKLARSLNKSGQPDSAVRKLLEIVSQSITDLVIKDCLPAEEALIPLLETYKRLVVESAASV